MTSDSRASWLLRAGLFVAGYFALAELGEPIRSDHIDASPVWLPHGLSLAAILLFGPRFWPVVAFAVAGRALGGGLPLYASVGLGLAKAAEALVARKLMMSSGRFNGTLDNVPSVLAFIGGGAVVASIPGAALCVVVLILAGLAPWTLFFDLTFTWWVGDAIGVLIVVPVVLAFVTARRWSFDRGAIIAIVTIGAALFGACELAFGRFVPPASALSFAYLPFPVIFWAAMRFGIHGAAISSSLAALHVIIRTLQGLGPFRYYSPVESYFLLETFMAVMVLTGLLLGAVINERRSVAHALKDSEKRHQLASSAGRVGVWDRDLDTDRIYVDPILKNILGYDDHEITNSVVLWRSLIHPDDRESVHRAASQYLAGETERFEVEHRMLHRDGSVRWFLARGEAQRDDAGGARQLTGTAVDITRQKLAEEALELGEQKIREQLMELEHIYQTAPVGLGLTDLDHRYVRINERLAAMNGWSATEHIGRSVRELMPNVAELVEPALRRVIETGQSHLIEVESSTPAWSGTALVAHYPRISADGNVSGVGVIVQDITPHKKAEALQAGNNRALELVAAGASLAVVLNELAANVEASTGRRCVVRLVSERKDSLELVAAPSFTPEDREALHVTAIGPSGGSCGQSADTRTLVVTRDVTADPAWAARRATAISLGLRSCWSTPILGSSDDVLGTVAIVGSEPGEPSETDIDAVENAAHLARVAIEHAGAREALTKSESSLRRSHAKVQHLAQRLIAAQEEERRRVSRELHDGLNQQLAALSFEIGKLRARVSAEPSMNERLSELQTRAARLIDDTRRMSHELHPSMLEHLGLVAAVRSYCDEETRRGALTVRFDAIRPPEMLAPETALCLFRIVQESVRNAAKHSGASAAQVTLRCSESSIVLTIADNGNGFDVDAERNGGLGLISMAERVRTISGQFSIVSHPNGGTRLEVRVPVGIVESDRMSQITRELSRL